MSQDVVSWADHQLNSLSDQDFLKAWIAVLGEPPAIVLDREFMVELLCSTGPLELQSAYGIA